MSAPRYIQTPHIAAVIFQQMTFRLMSTFSWHLLPGMLKVGTLKNGVTLRSLIDFLRNNWGRFWI